MMRNIRLKKICCVAVSAALVCASSGLCAPAAGSRQVAFAASVAESSGLEGAAGASSAELVGAADSAKSADPADFVDSASSADSSSASSQAAGEEAAQGRVSSDTLADGEATSVEGRSTAAAGSADAATSANAAGEADSELASESSRQSASALAAANDSALEPGTWTLASAAGGVVIDAEGGLSADGTAVQGWTSNDTDAQVWDVSYDEDGYATVRNAATGLALDVPGANAYEGAQLQLWTSNGTWAQKWIVVSDGSALKLVSALDTNLVVDLPGGQAYDGNRLQLWADNGTNAQRWLASPAATKRQKIDALAAANAGTLEPGTYAARSVLSSSFVLDAAGAGVEDGTVAQGWSANGTDAQAWLIEDAGDGYITVRNAASGLALDIPGADAYSGAQLQLWSPNGTLAQKWIAVRDDAGIRLISALDSSLVVDVPGASAVDGNRLQLYFANGTTAQRWNFVTPGCTQLIADGKYVVKSALNRGYVLDIEGASSDDGANAQLYESNGTAAQSFVFTWADGYYTISNAGSGKYLGMDAASAGNVCQAGGSATDDSRWSLRENADGSLSFTNLSSGLCMTASSSRAANCVNVQGAAPSYRLSAQKWFVEKASSSIESVPCALTLQAMSILNGGSGASDDAVTVALNPSGIQQADDLFYQFADCRGFTGQIDADQMNRIIDNSGTGRQGVFAGRGQAIIDAARSANINEMYFMAHIMVETGWGTSEQAQGRDFAAGDVTIDQGSGSRTKWCPEGRYYNFIGWGAYDSSPDTAYDFSRYYGWNSVETALTGAAEKVASNYLNNGQETVYEMRWNPDAASLGRVHQYCTDINWARTISTIMGYNYRLVGVSPELTYRVPQYL